jgi:hypothetical protein
MLDSVFILENLALLGQITIFYAPPNTGKTLIVFKLLIDQIKAGKIKGDNVFYIMADDNFNGKALKLELAEKVGFNMLLPGEEKFEAPMLAPILESIFREGKARNKIVILDTLKKFTDLMNKNNQGTFNDILRRFSSAGGSVITMAHTNKHKDDDGKLVYGGTGDQVQDSDCGFIMDSRDEDDTRFVTFTNIKNRGNVSHNLTFGYNKNVAHTYEERLSTVKLLDGEEVTKMKVESTLRKELSKNQGAINALKDALGSGINKKTELIQEASSLSGLSKKQIVHVLNKYMGEQYTDHKYWKCAATGLKNAKVYTLNKAPSAELAPYGKLNTE